MDAAVDRYIRHSTILATDNSAHSWVSMLPRNVFPCKFNVTVGTLPSGMYIYTHTNILLTLLLILDSMRCASIPAVAERVPSLQTQ